MPCRAPFLEFTDALHPDGYIGQCDSGPTAATPGGWFSIPHAEICAPDLDEQHQTGPCGRTRS